MEPLSVARRSRWTLLDQGVLETQEEEAAGAASTGVEAEVALTEKAEEGVDMAEIVVEDTEEERAAMAVVVAVGSAESAEVEAAASTEAEAGVAWMVETEVMVVVLIEGGVAMVAVVVAVAMVAASPEDTREVVGVAVGGEASRMPMVSRSKPTKSVVASHLF